MNTIPRIGEGRQSQRLGLVLKPEREPASSRGSSGTRLVRSSAISSHATADEIDHGAWTVRGELICHISVLWWEIIVDVRLFLRGVLTIAFGSQRSCNVALDAFLLRKEGTSVWQ